MDYRGVGFFNGMNRRENEQPCNRRLDTLHFNGII